MSNGLFRTFSILSLLWRCGPTRAMASSFLRFLDHTQRRITVGRTPLDEWSAPRRDLYLTTHNSHNRQISMNPVGFEPTILAGERPQTYALDRADTGTGTFSITPSFITSVMSRIRLETTLLDKQSLEKLFRIWHSQYIYDNSQRFWKN